MILTGATLNWDAVEAILNYGVVNSIRKEPSLVPIMLSDGLFETEKEKAEVCYVSIYSIFRVIEIQINISPFNTRFLC